MTRSDPAIALESDARRLYKDLAWTWPIISPPEDYVSEAKEFERVIARHSKGKARNLLHLGCGGGHIDMTLKNHFRVIGVDISTSMLRLARRLNPEVKYIKGDMRSVNLKDRFDAVLIADSINYMLTVRDLTASFKTAFRHLLPGGVFVLSVEMTPERFTQGRTQVSSHLKGNTEIVFVENTYDPNRRDSTYEVTFIYLIRKGKRLEVETDRHLAGMFPLKTWRRLLKEAGFIVSEFESTSDASGSDSAPLLVCSRP